MARVIKTIPSYLIDKYMVQFFPVENTPGVTHRVVIAGQATDWLSATHKPNQKNAVFFLDKWLNK